jgi:23S rRNA maturation-related 3'-5' exoribonuclease YhaM
MPVAIHHCKMETNTPDEEELEWQRVKAAILRIDHTTREINQKLSHVIELDRDDRRRPPWEPDE